MPPQQTTELAIVGGGVIGLSIAWRVAAGGASVRVFDAAEAGRGASWAAAGILPPPPRLGATDPIDRLRAHSHERFEGWCRSLAEAGGVDPEFRRCGGLYVARGRGEAATLAAQQMIWQEQGVRWESWPAGRLRGLSPHLAQLAGELERSGPGARVWHLPDECSVRNPRLVRALLAACRGRGVDFVENCRVEAVEPGGGTGRCTLATDRGTFAAGQVCLAGGAWAQRLLEPLGVRTGVLPVRGQMLLYKLPEPPFGAVLNDGHRYLVPRADGHVLAGSCEEEVGFHCGTTPEMLDELKRWVEGVVPGWGRHFVRGWAGLRPGSFDGLPYIGRLPQSPNVLLAAGHYRSGLHLSIATADIVAALVRGETPPIDPSPFHVSRGRTAPELARGEPRPAVRS